jgi:ZIP family zinc transporter
MLPEAYEEGGAMVGVVTTIGFLAAFMLSHME